MTKKHRGFTIEVVTDDGQLKVTVKRDDGSLIEHPNNPDWYEDEEDAFNHGMIILDEFLDEM